MHRTEPRRAHPWLLWLAFVLAVSCAVITVAQGRDAGQWAESDPEISAWYSTLKQPDNPAVSCCGEADAYWADDVEVVDGKVFAIITDPRPDEPLRRPHIAPGTRVEVPPHKLKWNAGNPTGHIVIFLRPDLHVLCYVQGTLS